MLPAAVGTYRGLKSTRISVSWVGALITLLTAFSLFADTAGSQVITRELHSNSLAHTKIGTNPDRHMTIYLPPGYDASLRRYPVIYFFPGADNDHLLFDQNGAQSLFDKAIKQCVIHPFILVSVDMNTPLGNSWFLNSPVTGNWEDFVIQELVPYIDANFKTLALRNSRGVAGDRMGGYGAIRFGMTHPGRFWLRLRLASGRHRVRYSDHVFAA